MGTESVNISGQGVPSPLFTTPFKFDPKNYDQVYFGHGKILLSGEYVVLDGAGSVALTAKLGQSMGVKYTKSFSPKLSWEAYNNDGSLWFKSIYECWNFNSLDSDLSHEAKQLQKILREARKQNKHFLRESTDTLVQTHVQFPIEWGLGSSSTLIYNIAQWAYVSPFALNSNIFGGSGYDIACAQGDGAIFYQKSSSGPTWTTVSFNPSFKHQLYFIYLCKKENTRGAIYYYKNKCQDIKELVSNITEISHQLLKAQTLREFEELMVKHEELLAKKLALKTVKEKYFSDFWGECKSLGAWGGDFVLVTSSFSQEKTYDYFKNKGFQTILRFDELMLESKQLKN